MPPPAYTPGTLNRQKSKIPTPSTFTVVAPNVLSPIKHKPTGVPSFTSSMGTTYYLPEK